MWSASLQMPLVLASHPLSVVAIDRRLLVEVEESWLAHLPSWALSVWLFPHWASLDHPLPRRPPPHLRSQLCRTPKLLPQRTQVALWTASAGSTIRSCSARPLAWFLRHHPMLDFTQEWPPRS